MDNFPFDTNREIIARQLKAMALASSFITNSGTWMPRTTTPRKTMMWPRRLVLAEFMHVEVWCIICEERSEGVFERVKRAVLERLERRLVYSKEMAWKLVSPLGGCISRGFSFLVFLFLGGFLKEVLLIRTNRNQKRRSSLPSTFG